MAYVYPYERADGFTTWRFQFTDWTGRRRTRTSPYPSEQETRRYARKIEAQQKAIRDGFLPPPDSASDQARRPFAEVCGEYLEWGETQGGHGGRPWSAGHARMRRSRLAWWREQLGFAVLGDLEGALPRVEAALRDLKSQGRSGKTLQHYAGALHAFCRWCVQRRYLSDDPLAHLRPFDTSAEETRRSLTVAEARRLLSKCAPKRRLCYETALLSGIRLGALRALQVEDLDAEDCTLHLAPEHNKARREAWQPIPSALAARLTGTADSNAPTAPLLYVPTHGARDLRKDLDAAGIARATRQGKLDFHAL
ncbi:MAG: hypothetical protein R6V05_00400, partial [Candidatus Brocadiia bacterium]